MFLVESIFFLNGNDSRNTTVFKIVTVIFADYKKYFLCVFRVYNGYSNLV